VGEPSLKSLPESLCLFLKSQILSSYLWMRRAAILAQLGVGGQGVKHYNIVT
jgi:hypothetical protein